MNFQTDYQNIIVETRGRVGIIRLNRPQALNALNSPLNPGTRRTRSTRSRPTTASAACCITGSEKAFAAGADIKEMAAKRSIDVYMRRLRRPTGTASRVRASR